MERAGVQAIVLDFFLRRFEVPLEGGSRLFVALSRVPNVAANKLMVLRIRLHFLDEFFQGMWFGRAFDFRCGGHNGGFVRLVSSIDGRNDWREQALNGYGCRRGLNLSTSLANRGSF